MWLVTTHCCLLNLSSDVNIRSFSVSVNTDNFIKKAIYLQKSTKLNFKVMCFATPVGMLKLQKARG